jgi:hypothetical protein
VSIGSKRNLSASLGKQPAKYRNIININKLKVRIGTEAEIDSNVYLLFPHVKLTPKSTKS